MPNLKDTLTLFAMCSCGMQGDHAAHATAPGGKAAVKKRMAATKIKFAAFKKKHVEAWGLTHKTGMRTPNPSHGSSKSKAGHKFPNSGMKKVTQSHPM